jgi:hypothetical protein
VEQPTKSQINCSICTQPVALEIAKTEDSGQAVHEEYYVLKLGVESRLSPRADRSAMIRRFYPAIPPPSPASFAGVLRSSSATINSETSAINRSESGSLLAASHNSSQFLISQSSSVSLKEN